jgi:hypothetical protein
VQLWCNGIIEFKVDTHNRKFVVTPIMRGGGEGARVDATEMRERFIKDQR